MVEGSLEGIFHALQVNRICAKSGGDVQETKEPPANILRYMSLCDFICSDSASTNKAMLSYKKCLFHVTLA